MSSPRTLATVLLMTLGAALLLALLLALPVHAAPAPVALPLEVLGAEGTTVSATFRLSRPAVQMTAQVHGLENEAEGSVQIGNGPWTPLTNATVAVSEPGKSYGGIGGGYHTLTFSLPLVNVRSRAIRVTWRFDKSDGVNFGYRVLSFNFQDAQGQDILPAPMFTQHDPAMETPPLPDAASIAQGDALWHSAPLVHNPGGPVITAACANCHSEDGRDLKYFGYSNNTIIKRCAFHGLTPLQGLQITSFLRSRPVAVAGRPWNPPYQPGAGLDAQGMQGWAAGAGLEAVLAHDEDMLAPLMANDFSTASTLNMRELPISLPLPDWNQWLPRVYPGDAWGETFTGSELYKMYDGEGDNPWQWGSLRGHLSDPASSANFIANGQSGLRAWLSGWQTQAQVLNTALTQQAQADNWQGNEGEAVYAASQWKLVKTWELMQEFGLEDKAPLIYGPGGETHSWLDGSAFYAAPFMNHIPESVSLTGGPASPVQFRTLDNQWYALQFVLDSGNRHREGWTPVDWGYSSGRMKDLANLTHQPEALRLTAMYVKGMQQSDVIGAVTQSQGWSPLWAANLAYLTWDNADYGFGNVNADVYDPDPIKSRAVRVRVLSALLGAWQVKMSQYPAQAYYDAGFASPTDTTQDAGRLAGNTYAFLRDMKALGASPSNLAFMAAWAKTVWPSGNWSFWP